MQYKAFMIKYAEIGTKGKNRYIFEDILVKNINRKIKNYMRKNVSFLEAYKKTAQAVTIPGASEHQIGLALDIISNTYTALITLAGGGESLCGHSRRQMAGSTLSGLWLYPALSKGKRRNYGN